MEASALSAPAGLARPRPFGARLLKLRADEQLVALFRAGDEDAFRVIHDRYRARIFAYTRQMLAGSRQDAEEALQDVFVRAYIGLRSDGRALALRAWLYRVAHNRCIDALRRPGPVLAPVEVLELMRAPGSDPLAETERRESLRRLVADVRRLPEQQRSALLMRELAGMSYTEIAGALGVSVGAVKSLLVRARVGLAKASEARDAACAEIRVELSGAHDRGTRASGLARLHLHDCRDCRAFRGELRGTSQGFAALAPAVGLSGLVVEVLGLSGGGAAAGGGALGGGAVGAAGAGGAGAAGLTGAVATSGAVAGTAATHVATLLAAAVITAGGANGLSSVVAGGPSPPHNHPAPAVRAARTPLREPPRGAPGGALATSSNAGTAAGPAASAPGDPTADDAGATAVAAAGRSRDAAAAAAYAGEFGPSAGGLSSTDPSGTATGTPPAAGPSAPSAAAAGSPGSGATDSPSAAATLATVLPALVGGHPGPGSPTGPAPTAPGRTGSPPPSGAPSSGTGSGSATSAKGAASSSTTPGTTGQAPSSAGTSSPGASGASGGTAGGSATATGPGASSAGGPSTSGPSAGSSTAAPTASPAPASGASTPAH